MSKSSSDKFAGRTKARELNALEIKEMSKDAYDKIADGLNEVLGSRLIKAAREGRAIAQGLVVLDLPTPPSINETRRVDWRGHQKLKAWRTEAGWALRLNGQHKQPKVVGQFEVDIIVSDHGNRKDIDNICKSVCDFLKLHQFIVDDGPQYMRSLSLRFTDTELNSKECRVIISPVDDI